MALPVKREDADDIVQRALERMRARGKQRDKPLPAIDTWAEKNFWLPETGKAIVLEHFQRAVLRYAFTRASTGAYPFSTVVLSTVKKTGKCCTPETPILMIGGSQKRADEVKLGDKIIAWGGEGLCEDTILQVEEQPAEPIVEVETARGRILRTTAAHPYLIWGDEKPPALQRQATAHWVAAGDLHSGQRVMVALGWGGGELLDEEEAYALGVWVGDGGGTRITCSTPAIAERLRRSHDLYDHKQRDRAPHYTVKDARKWLTPYDLWDKGSREKRVPRQVMGADPRAKAAFLSGYLDSDGYVDKLDRRQPGVEWASSNRDLLVSAQHLLAGLGFNARLTDRKTLYKYRGGEQRGIAWRLIVAGRDQVARLADVLTVVHPEKRKRLDGWQERHEREGGWTAGSFGHDRITAVRHCEPQKTIGIETAEAHTHVTAGLITHNTTMAALIGRWVAETQTRFGEVYTMGNDMRQAKDRSFAMMKRSIEMTPGYRHRGNEGVLPDKWICQTYNLNCLLTGTKIEALSVDAKGEAGSNPDLTIWCVPTDTPILTADLRWVPGGDLVVGDQLVGFDEDTPAYNCSRRYQTATVTGFVVQELPCKEIVLDGDAPLRATPQHMWLTRSRRVGKNKMVWKRTDELEKGDELAQLLPVWQPDRSYEAGYVAAAFDGEGHLSPLRGKGSAGGYTLGITQVRDKHLLEAVDATTQASGLTMTRIEELPQIEGRGPVDRLRLNRLADVVKLLGVYRPLRLLGNFSPDQMGHIRGCQWRCVLGVGDVGKQRMACIQTDTKTYVARGYGAHNTELWGFEDEAAVKFYNEMTPVPTKHSVRLIETYAGFEGESELLRGIYDDAMGNARQITAGELAMRTGTGLGVFEEAPGPDDLVPIWVNEQTGLFVWWDSGAVARRMPWQRGERGEQYYREQAAGMPPAKFRRLHENVWGSGEGDFIPIEMWDACYDPELGELEDGDRTPVVIAVDGAVSGDCFAIVVGTRHPKNKMQPAVRGVKVWTPPKGGRIDFDEPEAFLRTICQGGCANGHPRVWQKQPEECDHARPGVYGCRQCCEACAAGAPGQVMGYNVLEAAYDQYQLAQMMRNLYKEGINTQSFDQGGARLVADAGLYKRIMTGGISHRNSLELRAHMLNAGGKLSKEEDNKMRIVKRGGVESRKIDAVVATSMFSARMMYYTI